MEIIVQGKGESFYTPNQVVLDLSFFIKAGTYDEALTNGSNNVFEFINKILITNGFSKEDMKTNRFSIRKETKYNEITKTHDLIGYSYNQNAIIKFDYEKERLSKIMEEISKMDMPPFYDVDFTVKDIKACKRDNLTKAYKDAEEQAQIIAQAAEKTLKQCVKVDFQPFTTEYISKGYESDMVMNNLEMSAAKTINAVFTPEDVKISETLYCLWIAE